MNIIARRIGYASALSSALIAAPCFAYPQAGSANLQPGAQAAPLRAPDAAATSHLIGLHYEQTALLARRSSHPPVAARGPDAPVPHGGAAVNPGQATAEANPPQPGPRPE